MAKLEKLKKLRQFLIPGLVLIVMVVIFLLLGQGQNERGCVLSGMRFELPEGFKRSYIDSRYSVWIYPGQDKKPGRLVLDADIHFENGEKYTTVEEVLEYCDWLEGRELFVNDQGVRMVRGFTDYSGAPERRYYIESEDALLLMCMIEDERFYDFEDCEEAMLETAQRVTRQR